MMKSIRWKPIGYVLAFFVFCSTGAHAQWIQHDAEHYVLLHQYKDQWAAEDKEIDRKLAAIREKTGGEKPLHY